MRKLLVMALSVLLISGCNQDRWNNPHADSAAGKTFYSSFDAPPKTLDPARSYSANETLFIGQIYEPPLQYDLLKRPYALTTLTAATMPTVTYYDQQGNQLTDAAPAAKVAYSNYRIQIKPGIFYAPHPAFAKDNQGHYYYHALTADQIENLYQLSDLQHTGSRELTADDYIYQIKRLAHPELNSPILGVMTQYIVGLDDYTTLLQTQHQKNIAKFGKDYYLDLRQFPLAGVKKIDNYTYQITIKGKYPQFNYWLAMPFFAPIPWEADYFYSQPEMEENNLTFDWYPVGTGPYMLVENNPNKQMVLAKNPNFHGEEYPGKSALADAKLPLIDRYVFALEKESIPRWSKFLQGYYDRSAISSDSFDQAIKVDQEGNPELTPEMQKKGIYLQTTVAPSIYYYGFNMLDDVVGGNSERAKKLRQAISIALDQEEMIAIFLNGRGFAAHSPIPPGITGHGDDYNPVVYQAMGNQIKRKPLSEAKRLLKEAGYANGRDQKTGKPLVLNYDVTASSGPDDKARFDWMRKQFSKLGIELNIRATQYNRFQEKMRSGNAQLFMLGWIADYPDPENFLFLFYGPNSKVKAGGENSTNYNNPEFDRLFEQLRGVSDDQQRNRLVNQMVTILRDDAPWIWGFYPKSFVLAHQWVESPEPNAMVNNGLKYININNEQRQSLSRQWNHPELWPLSILFLLVLAAIIPLIVKYHQSQHRPRFRG